MIKLIKRIFIKDNMLYFMERYREYIFLNDLISGIMLMNNDLELVESLDCNKEGPIEFPLFTCFSKNAVILNTWPEEEFVYVDLDTREYKKISLEDKPNYYYSFGPLYWWSDPNEIIFYAPHKDVFVLLTLTNEKFELVSSDEVSKLYPDFYNLYKQINNFKPSGSLIKRVRLLKKEVLIEDEVSNCATVKNFETGEEYSCEMPMVSLRDICYSGHNFVFVNEEIVFLENVKLQKKVTLLPDEDYVFDGVIFLNSSTIVVLAGTGGGFDAETQTSTTVSSLSIYEIFED